MDRCGILKLQSYTSPLGNLLLGEVDARLCLCYWAEAKFAEQVLCGILRRQKLEVEEVPTRFLDMVKEQLDDYFSGKRSSFDLPYLLVGTDFQKTIWKNLENIGYGETISYLALATNIGCPKAVRAVANAIGKNPLQLVLPCHRVVGVNGNLVGYAGGVDAKQSLLNMERRFCGNKKQNRSM